MRHNESAAEWCNFRNFSDADKSEEDIESFAIDSSVGENEQVCISPNQKRRMAELAQKQGSCGYISILQGRQMQIKVDDTMHRF